MYLSAPPKKIYWLRHWTPIHFSFMQWPYTFKYIDHIVFFSFLYMITYLACSLRLVDQEERECL